ncbi:hypothetical protein [Halorubrum sp. GN11_10-6_MGM]|nr:hypothetical protein [Halorubrum sp. GN11_10-6_MGM]
MGDSACDREFCPECDLAVTRVDEVCPECGASLDCRGDGSTER